MGEKEDTQEPVRQAKDDAVGRLSERLGDPFLFSFLIVFVVREWRFLYVIATGIKDPLTAIKNADEFLPWWAIPVDIVIAAAYVFVWPWINRIVVGYLADQAVRTENRRDAAKRGRYLKLRSINDHPEHARALALVRDLSALSSKYGTQALNVIGNCRVGIAGHEALVVPGFAACVQNHSGPPSLRPLELGSGDGQGFEPVYVVDEFIGPMDRFVLFVRCPATVPWPNIAVPKRSIAGWRDGAWTEDRIKPGEPHLRRQDDGRGVAQVGAK